MLVISLTTDYITEHVGKEGEETDCNPVPRAVAVSLLVRFVLTFLCVSVGRCEQGVEAFSALCTAPCRKQFPGRGRPLGGWSLVVGQQYSAPQRR